MSRWFRFYDDAINEPKLLKLSDAAFRTWVGLLCIASKSAGRFPPADDIALMLRQRVERIVAVLAELTKAGLVDQDETGLFPHNWNTRQYKSDVSNERVGRYRERQRNAGSNVTGNKAVTPSDTEADTEQSPATQAAEPPKPIDLAKQVWDTGVAFLVSRSVDPRQARNFLGKLRKTNDDAAILAALARAEAATAVDPIPFLTATLKGKSDGKRREDRDTQRRRRRSEILEGLGATAPVERGEHSAHGGEPDPRRIASGTAERSAGGPEGAGRRGGENRGVGGGVQHAGGGLEGGDGVLSREPGASAGRPVDGSVPGRARNPQVGNAPALAERVAGGGERADGRAPAVDCEAGDRETLPNGDRPPATNGRGESSCGRDHEPVAQQARYNRDADLEIPPQFRRTA